MKKISTEKFSDHIKEQQMLISNFKKLSRQKKAIVEVLAVIFDQTSKTNILNCLQKLKIRGHNGKALTMKELTKLTAEMDDTGVFERKDKYKCNSKLAEPVCRMLSSENRFEETAIAVQKVFSVYGYNRQAFYVRDYFQFVREFRIGIYKKDAKYIRDLISNNPLYASAIRNSHPYVKNFYWSFDGDWYAKNLPAELFEDILISLSNYNIHHMTPACKNVFFSLENYAKSIKDHKAGCLIQKAFAEQLIFRGRLKEADKILAKIEGIKAFALKGFLFLLSGKTEDSIICYKKALKLLKKKTRKRNVYFNNIQGIFFILALIKSRVPENKKNAEEYATIGADDNDNPYMLTFDFLRWMIEAQAGDIDAAHFLEASKYHVRKIETVSDFINILCLYWTNKESIQKNKQSIKDFYEEREEAGYEWLASESALLLSKMIRGDKKYKKKAAALQKKRGIKSIVDIVKPEMKWKKILTALTNLKKNNSSENQAEKSSRMVWLFDYSEKYSSYDISPRVQKKTVKGIWSKGMKVALKRLYHDKKDFAYLTPQDLDICSHLHEEYETGGWGRYRNVYYCFDDTAVTALIGHPLIFWEDSPSVQLEIVKGSPELIVDKDKNGKIKIAFSHSLNLHRDIQLIKESPTRMKVIETGEQVVNIAKIIGKGVKVPASAKKQVLEAIDSVSSVVTVHSAVSGSIDSAKEVTADPTPCVHLLPYGQGIKLEVLVRPFSKGGPYFRPGRGGETVISEIDGKQLQTRRDLDKEKALADNVAASCSTLLCAENSFDDADGWKLEEPEDCLQIMLELKALGDSIILEWPEGESFKIKHKADMKNFFLNIKKGKDWFSVSGELKLDDGLVLSMMELLNLLENTPGKFIRLEDGQFLALTGAFRKRLDELSNYSKKSGKSLQFHPLAALSLDDLSQELGGLESDKHWKSHLKRFDKASKLKPRVPSTFKAELRDYQKEGFKWLARLAHWGVGACLADDMGLGKTIQALAMIVKNARKGPALIIAPTSVCMNWQFEAERFAPTLNVKTFENGDRKKVLNKLKSFDMLVVSYGLLQQEKTAELLTQVHFATIVLDEAQAIKNFTTKRSQAAMKLDGDFKLITTGTPIENHLGELWNLFRFINPGLLGSFKQFNEKFSTPIEKYQDKATGMRLKKLIQPFTLRRTKGQVLEELPPRTDILLQVELSSDEIAVYEALRQKAIETFANAKGAAGKKHLQILAEIMKLRRACCNVQLILPDAAIPSSKLAVFGNIVDELLENRHKALVFSQFVGHLQIIREYVEEKKISYQYLDGSTPQKERKKRVEAFQAGEGDLFLISLKAGGLGLNLTAADYVIHMDPWWNPAVEDQASDRAHRIGQKRPVTVYRLVAQHTIEEKIVALHKKKRDLADSLLDGADMSGKMSADELIKLIKEH